jgi:eukaryotic-like serine/threonine-protein kinase
MTSEADILNSRFRRVLRLGRGGQASVWLGEDTWLERPVALKQLLRRGGGEDVSARARAIQEAQAMARVRHPAIVTIYDILFVDGDPSTGDPWLVMEFIDGKTLQELIDSQSPAAPLDDATIARIGLAVLDGLSAVHRADIVHRDVKPGNILIAGDLASGDYSVFLVDFGIAMISGRRRVTLQNNIIGTPAYIAPERLRNEPVGRAADVWSLGVTLYCAVDGASPFSRDGEYADVATRQAILADEPLPPRRESALTGIIFRMLDKDPGQRADADEVRTTLAAIVRRARRRSQLTVPDTGQLDADGYLQTPQRSASEPSAPLPSERSGSGVGSGPAGQPRSPLQPESPPPGRLPPTAAPRPAPSPGIPPRHGGRADARKERIGPPHQARMRVDDVRDLILTVGTDTGVAMLLSIPRQDAAAILASCPDRAAANLLTGMASAQPRAASAMMDMLSTGDAARLLEHLGNGTAAEVLAGMPPRHVVRILDAASDQTAARAIKNMSVRSQVLLLRAMNSYRAAAVLSDLKPAAAAAVLRGDTVLWTAVWPLVPQPEQEQIARYLPD